MAPDESTALVAQRLGVRSLPEPVSTFIRQRAGGNPFFSEEIAYGRLLIAQRRQLHRSVAEWLESTHASNIDPYFPLLAYHWGSAARARARTDQDLYLARKALKYADKSGEQALRNSAYLEAINFYTEALALGADPLLEVPPEQRANCLQQLGEAYHQ